MSDPIHEFTAIVPYWRPRVTPIQLEDATPDQLDALKVTPSNTKVSEYVLVLARDSETLRERTPLFNAIMYNRGGLSRAERELGAVGALTQGGSMGMPELENGQGECFPTQGPMTSNAMC